MGTRYYQLCFHQSPQEEGDLEFLQPPHIAGSCSRFFFFFFVNCSPFPFLWPGLLRAGSSNPDSFQGHRDQIALAQVGAHFQSPCLSHPALYFYQQLGVYRELARVSHSRLPLPKGDVLDSLLRFLGMPLEIPPDGNCFSLNISFTRPDLRNFWDFSD